MKIVRPEIDSFALERLRAQTLDVLTGGTGRANSETLRSLDLGIRRTLASADPRGEHVRTTIVAVTDAGVETADGFIASPMFARVAGAASGERHVVFALATVGEAFDEKLSRETSLLDKFVLDAVGSELAEIVADLVEETWKNEVAVAGMEASLRMSPGYCDWAIQGQDIVFTALDASAVGVRLTPSYLMIPAKSVSSAAVAAERLPVKVPCEICPAQGCPFRRTDFYESA